MDISRRNLINVTAAGAASAMTVAPALHARPL
jgi:hypothetical protein